MKPTNGMFDIRCTMFDLAKGPAVANRSFFREIAGEKHLFDS